MERFRVRELEGGYEVRCPAGCLMRRRGASRDGCVVFKGTACQGCALQSACTAAKDGVRTFRFRPELRRLQEEQWTLRKTDAYRAALKARMATVESRFGHGKTYHNLGKSIYRSLPMQRIQSCMSLLAMNLEKLVTHGPGRALPAMS